MMKRILIALFALFAASAASAQCGGVGGYPGLCYNPATLVTPAVGKSTLLVSNTTDDPGTNACVENDTTSGGSCGAFRTACKTASMGPHDPIINPPGTVNGSHLHTFMGSVGTDGDTDVDIDPQDAAENSTCKGGIGNRTRYWFPTMIDVRSGAAIAPKESAGSGSSIYYKTLGVGATRVNTFPRGYRIIAGNSTSAVAQTGIRYRCVGSGSPGGNYTDLWALPYCGAGNEVIFTVEFPQCVALDGLAPYGTLSGTYLSTWKPIPTFWELMYFEGVAAGDIANLVVTAGGGAAAPTVTTDREGTSTLKERAHITVPALTAGQWIEVAGRRYTSTGASTALQVAQALAGGSPLLDSVDHKSHAVVQGNLDPKIGCPDSNPYATPSPQFEVHYAITSEEQQRAMRLSTDTYKGPGGRSGHGDIVFGWDEDFHRKWLLGCDRTGGDCSGHMLGCKDPTTGEPAQCQQMLFN